MTNIAFNQRILIQYIECNVVIYTPECAADCRREPVILVKFSQIWSNWAPRALPASPPRRSSAPAAWEGARAWQVPGNHCRASLGSIDKAAGSRTGGREALCRCT